MNCHQATDAGTPLLISAAATFANTAMLLHPRYSPKVTAASTVNHDGHVNSCRRSTSRRTMWINAATITMKTTTLTHSQSCAATSSQTLNPTNTTLASTSRLVSHHAPNP